jgi:chemotaxis protein CheX
MDVRFVNPFLNGVLEVLHTMAQIKVVPSTPILKKSRRALGDVSGVMTLTGEAKGTLSASFSFGMVQHVMENMLGEYVTHVDDFVKDTVGELTNMVSGVARKYMNQQGLRLVASIPMVVCGKGSYLPHSLQGPLLVIPFQGERGDIYVEAAFKDKNYQRAVSSEQESEKGLRSLSKGNLAEAAERFAKALRLNDQNLQAAFGMSKVYMAAGEKDLAMQLIRDLSRTATVLEPYYKHIFNASGIMMRELGMYNEAISMYQRALDVTQDDENLWFNLARAYFHGGKPALARRAINKCLNINPHMKEAQIVNKKYLSG